MSLLSEDQPGQDWPDPPLPYRNGPGNEEEEASRVTLEMGLAEVGGVAFTGG